MMYEVSMLGFILNVDATSKAEAVTLVSYVHQVEIDKLLTSNCYPFEPTTEIRYYTALQIYTTAGSVVDVSCKHILGERVVDDLDRAGRNMPYKSRVAQLASSAGNTRRMK